MTNLNRRGWPRSSGCVRLEWAASIEIVPHLATAREMPLVRLMITSIETVG